MSQMPTKKIIGITGNIASGKSTVTKYLIDKGYKVIDTDLITQDVYEKSAIFKQEIVTIFGRDIIKENKIDKTEISKQVFSDKNKLAKLNQLIHPIIFEQTKAEIESSTDDIVFVDVPLLFEAKFDVLCTQTVVVTISLENQIKRLMMRNNYTKEEAMARINAQMPQEEKISLADYQINNDNTIKDLYLKIDQLLKILES